MTALAIGTAVVLLAIAAIIVRLSQVERSEAEARRQVPLMTQEEYQRMLSAVSAVRAAERIVADHAGKAR